MKFLKDRLLEDKKITVLLDEVAEGKIFKRAIHSENPSSEEKPTRGTSIGCLFYSYQYCVGLESVCASANSFVLMFTSTAATQFFCFLAVVAKCHEQW